MTKLALITGGSRGIGAATCELLRGKEWDVYAPPRGLLDFADQPTIVFQEHQWLKHGVPSFDALVFCHGEWYSKPDEDRQVVDWYRQYTLRVVWPFEFMEFILGGHYKPQSVTFVASTQAFGGNENTGPYAAACAAQVRLVAGYARSRKGTRFNVVCPGLSDTVMAALVRASGDCAPDAVAQPAEAVAAAIVGLIESDANGKVLRVVDGQASEAKWSW